MPVWLAVGIGGFFGAIARYEISRLIHARMVSSFPWGTLAVNLLGCFLIGLAMGLVGQKQMSETQRVLLVTGFLGSLTTFSTFSYETLALMKPDFYSHAFANILVNVVLGLLAAALGGKLALTFAPG